MAKSPKQFKITKKLKTFAFFHQIAPNFDRLYFDIVSWEPLDKFSIFEFFRKLSNFEFLKKFDGQLLGPKKCYQKSVQGFEGYTIVVSLCKISWNSDQNCGSSSVFGAVWMVCSRV